MKLRLVGLALLALLSLLPGCRSGRGIDSDPILRLSASESLAEGKKMLADEKYAKARKYLSHAFEVEPNSASGREALLLVADTYYLEGGSRNFIEAESKYRDFLNRFPTSDQAAYAQLQVANSLAERMEKPDRDQSPTYKALEAYQDLLRLYPTSEYADQARERMKAVRENLAEHEFIVGFFNFRVHNYRGAVDRWEYLLANYPDYGAKDKALFYLATAYSKSKLADDRAKAADLFQRLRSEYPDSSFVRQIPTTRDDGKVSP